MLSWLTLKIIKLGEWTDRQTDAPNQRFNRVEKVFLCVK